MHDLLVRRTGVLYDGQLRKFRDSAVPGRLQNMAAAIFRDPVSLRRPKRSLANGVCGLCGFCNAYVCVCIKSELRLDGVAQNNDYKTCDPDSTKNESKNLYEYMKLKLSKSDAKMIPRYTKNQGRAGVVRCSEQLNSSS